MEVTEKQNICRQLPSRICDWYAENKRPLPWRENKDPYRIWVSEIMLQQTRVEAVKPYFARFLHELPDIEALAVCREEKLLKLWEGLGYYSRVRNMQKTARQITGLNDESLQRTADRSRTAALPRDPEELQKLPGIGSYTAGAIASIAYGIPVPAVDGNVLRILARITADDADILKASVKREAEKLLTEILRDTVGNTEIRTGIKTDPGDFNQGMMDLGSGICLPNSQPLCGLCPLEDICESHRTGKETSYPFRKKAKGRRIEQRTILVIRDGDRVALARRQEKGLLAGMYEFPNLAGRLSRNEVLQAVAEQDLEPLYIQKLDPAKHLFSHVEWQMTGYEIRVSDFPERIRETYKDGEKDGVRQGSRKEWFLAEIGQIEKTYPLPSAFRAYAQYLQVKPGADGNIRGREKEQKKCREDQDLNEDGRKTTELERLCEE